MAARDKLLYNQTALWDCRASGIDSCLLGLQASTNDASYNLASSSATSASGHAATVAPMSASTTDGAYMSSSSLHTASMISDLVNKLVDSEDDQMPPSMSQPPLHMQQSPQAQEMRSPRPLVCMQPHQLAPAPPPQPNVHSLPTSASVQQPNWVALQACHIDSVQSARAEAALKSATAAAAIARASVPHQHSQHHHATLMLPPATNYILLRPPRAQFLHLAPASGAQQLQTQAASGGVVQSAMVAMAPSVGGSPNQAGQASMRRTAQAESDRSERFEELVELRRLLDKELRDAVAGMCAWQGMRFGGRAASPTSTSSPPRQPPASSLSLTPTPSGKLLGGANCTREDRELLAVSQDHGRLQQLVQRAEKLRNATLPASVHSALDRLSEAVRKCQARRKEEVTSQNNRGGGSGSSRVTDERDSRAVASALGELLEQLQHSRTCMWAALQMALADAGDENDADVFRRLETRRQELADLRADPYTEF